MASQHDLGAVDGVALIKFGHVLVGVYIWEFVLNLDYEYSIITRKRKFIRTLPLYVGCRWCTLSLIIVALMIADSPCGFDCHATVIASYRSPRVFGYLSFLFASGLVILRIYALWEHNKVVIAFTSAVWLANTAIYIYNAVASRGYWEGNTCDIDHAGNTRTIIISIFISDLILFVLMLCGILRSGWKEARWNGRIWWLLYKQGLVWVVIFTTANIPPLVFVLLDLGGSLKQMFLVPVLLITSLGAGRMYRGLLDSLALDRSPIELVNIKEQSAKTAIRFAGNSHLHHQHQTGTCGPGAVIETRQCDGNLDSEAA